MSDQHAPGDGYPSGIYEHVSPSGLRDATLAGARLVQVVQEVTGPICSTCGRAPGEHDSWSQACPGPTDRRPTGFTTGTTVAYLVRHDPDGELAKLRQQLHESNDRRRAAEAAAAEDRKSRDGAQELAHERSAQLLRLDAELREARSAAHPLREALAAMERDLATLRRVFGERAVDSALEPQP